ncbi:cyclase family protein [Jannaschia sp. LMIT008]|uniref:cyclase family protein n=1 Tax=Jannaschia maritima TaxID=3032585 RepID=UPI0028123621|nr:cyclase family protein [Jannaschia sp. LMIT008]
MCHACVMEGAKRHMMNRRDLFGGAAAGAAAVAAGAMSARPALAQAQGRVVDLTHTFTPDFPTFWGGPGLAMEETVNFAESNYQSFRLTADEHAGTHLDAPLHFSEGSASVDEIAAEALMCPLCVIDISDRAAEDPNATVTPEDVEAWVSANGDIPEGACVAMRSGWAAKVGDPSFRGPGDGTLAFPGFAKAATDLLIDADVACIAVDTLSLDPGDSADFAVHYSWLPAGRYGIECVANLDAMPAAGATIVVGAPKHGGGTGGQARVLGIV